MLKVASDNPTFRALTTSLANNRKYKFDVTVGKWSITVRNNLDAAEKILDLCMPNYSPILVKRGGGKLFIYDSDVYLNRRFLNIFGPIHPSLTVAGLAPRLAIGSNA
jgi:hypothetical protein